MDLSLELGKQSLFYRKRNESIDRDRARVRVQAKKTS